MRTLSTFVLAFAVVLLAGLLPFTVAARPGAESAAIEQELLDAFDADGAANFFVKMAVEADLSAAYDITDWSARGQYVYGALQEVAAATQAPVIEYARRSGLEYTSMLVTNSVFIRGGNRASAEGLAAIPGVAYIRLERTIDLPDPVGASVNGLGALEAEPEGSLAWGIDYVDAEQVWNLGVRGAGIKVSNIDTGVQWDHPALVGQFACPGDPGNPDCWADPSNICGGSACDNTGHGTHTMGTMVALDDPALAFMAGMAPEATWITCKGCEASSCSDFALTTCADWIVAPGGDPDNRPHVVNNSWGGPGGDPWYMGYVNVWRASGVFPAFSAGNSGPNCDTLGTPGDYQESFSSASHDVGGTIANSSSRGPSFFGHDPYTKPNIAAPGVAVCSTIPYDSWSCISGTSMASPHSAGAVALLWSACPDYIAQMADTFELLQDNTNPAPAGTCGAPPDGEGNYTYGYGYLNALNAVMACLGSTDFGTLEGYVYDQDLNPVEGAAVTAAPATKSSGVDAVTDPSGFYTMQLLPGSYDVTASKYGYATVTEYDVEILANTTTVQSFVVESVPTWRPGTPAAFDWTRFDGVYNPNDGLIYFLGGRTGGEPAHDRSIWTYNPETGASVDTGIDMLYNAANYTIALIADDGTGRGEAMYVVGGYDVDTEANIDEVQRYYPQAGVVEDLPSDPYPGKSPANIIIGAGGLGVVDGKIYVFGGWESVTPWFGGMTYVFDPLAAAGSRWTNLGCELNPARAYPNSAVSNGLIYAMGGHVSYVGDLAPTVVAEVFDPADPGACWQPIAAMPVATAEGRGFGFDNGTENIFGKLYVVGGGDWPDASAEVLEYDIANDTWDDTFPELIQLRRNHAGVYVSAYTADPDDAFPSMWVFGGRVESDLPPYGDPEFYPLSLSCVQPDGLAFTWSPSMPLVGESVAFVASEPLAGTAPFSYSWDFGDGFGDVGMEVSHTYTTPGQYEVVLTVSNACDPGASLVKKVAVVAAGEPQYIYLPLTLNSY